MGLINDMYVDYVKANELEGQIKDLEEELIMATLNERFSDIPGIKAEIADLNEELEDLYWY